MQEITKPTTPESPDLPGARIIPFPARTADPVVAAALAPGADLGPVAALASVSEPNQADARLTRALNGLNSAITAQRAAMSAWKAALGDLRTVTGRLGASLRGYNDSLGHLDSRVKTLRAEAVKLESWADASPGHDGLGRDGLAHERETAGDPPNPESFAGPSSREGPTGPITR